MPIGLTLACKLRCFGIDVDIIDKRQRNTELLRAIAVNMATISSLESIGVAEQLIEQGEQIDFLNLYWKQQHMMQVSFDGQFPYDHFLHVYQPTTESLLIDRLAELGVSVKREVELIALKQSTSQVIATIRQEDDEVISQHYDYCVGCDGGLSSVRDFAEIDVDVDQYGSYFMLADVHLDWSGAIEQTHWFVGESGYLMIVPGPGGRHRLVASGLGQQPASMSLQDYQVLVDARGPGGITVTSLDWQAIAPFGHKIARTPRVGRVFLAGDAYHQFSPVGGINMNIGIADADNLAWKLAFVLNGQAADSLLESYTQERGDIVAQTLIDSRQRTAVITDPMSARLSEVKPYLPTEGMHAPYELCLQFAGLDVEYMPGMVHLSRKGLGQANQSNQFEWYCPREVHDNYQSFCTTQQIQLKEAADFILVRPDGFIAHQGKLSVSELQQTMSQLLGVNDVR